jgi:hypothetical protein
MTLVYWVYALLLLVLIVGAIVSLFGGFGHEYMDPGM